MTRPTERARQCRIPVELSKARKTYPHAVEDLDVTAGTELHGLAYRQYFDPAYSANATAVYWHRQGDAYVVYLDYHQAVARDVVPLPDGLVGLAITVVEQTPSVKLLSGPQVSATGIELSVTEDYGFIVLKLNAP